MLFGIGMKHVIVPIHVMQVKVEDIVMMSHRENHMAGFCSAFSAAVTDLGIESKIQRSTQV